MDSWSNIVRGNTSLHLRVIFYRGGGDPTSELTVEVRFVVSRRPHIHQPQVFRFLLSLSSLFAPQLRRLQVESMLSHVGHPHRSDVDSWTDHISSSASNAANEVIRGGYSGLLMEVYLNIPTVVHPYHVPSVGSAHARMQDGVLVLDDVGFGLDGDARMEDGVLVLDERSGLDVDWMLSLLEEEPEPEPDQEEEAGGTRGFGSVPASKSSIKTLDTKTYQGDGQDGSSTCSICLEILEAGAELTVLPCSHEFHCSCATKWLERSHLCPLCRYPMPTVDGEGATTA